MTTVDTLRYYPKHISSIEEFKRIAVAYDRELRLLWTALGQQVTNQSFDEMDEETCTRWEKLIGITITDSETLEERRRMIKGRWASSLPYTKPKFHDILRAMLGDNYLMTISVEQKTLVVSIFLVSMQKTDEVYQLIRAMAPADMDVIVKIQYNRWARFQPLTWGDLWNNGADTWADVKQNPKWQEE